MRVPRARRRRHWRPADSSTQPRRVKDRLPGEQGQGDLALDFSAPPLGSGAGQVAAFETWYFQCWFRDNIPALTSNFTDGVEIMFL